MSFLIDRLDLYYDFPLCFWASITFQVELGFSTYLLLNYCGFKWQEGTGWLKKPSGFHWKKLPNKNYRKIIVSKIIYRLKSLFQLVPVPFWEWPQQQVPPEASFAGCSDSDEPVHCRGTCLCIPHLWEITFLPRICVLLCVVDHFWPFTVQLELWNFHFARDWLWRYKQRVNAYRIVVFPRISD